MALSLDAIEWLQERAISVATVQPGSGLADLLPLKAVIGGARIVALGEATHGTHEFYTMRHRIIELLVAEMGFTLLALEAPWPAARRIDEYVRSGTGDPATLLRGLRYWIWSTREMLDLFEWIRAQNEGRADANRIRVAGFDMQSPQMAMDDVVAYVGGIDPVAGAASAARYETFRPYARALASYASVPSDIKARCRAQLSAAYGALNDRRVDYTLVSSTQEFAYALHSARQVLQAEECFSANTPALRERYMAENIAWLLDEIGPDARAVLWAHNVHVGMAPFGLSRSMGSYLRARYGDALVVVGATSFRGGFNAIAYDRGTGRYAGLAVHETHPPPADSHEYALRRANVPRMFLDLRGALPSHTGRAWPSAPRRMRCIGSVYDDVRRDTFFQEVQLPTQFDAILYLSETTPSIML
jgi:erythromycin esterase